ncbi:hypothetical protein [Flavobacterium sp. GT3R68]|nr:hypothetical protein [Flavobacterium sp. GT3R68]
MSNNSVSLHRVLKSTPEKIYRAFTEANARYTNKLKYDEPGFT